MAVGQLKAVRAPIRIYFDDANSWIYKEAAMRPGERNLLEILGTQLLLPLAVKGKLLGFVSLGNKRSEEPTTTISYGCRAAPWGSPSAMFRAKGSQRHS